MLTEVRARINAALASVPASRRPALRRSDDPGALLATDLPLVAEPSAVRAFSDTLTAEGFRVMPRNGWLLLDAPVPAPETDVLADVPGEAGCCLSLLVRHPDDGDAADAIRAIVKAAEAGRQPFERLCARLHADLAGKLRLHQSLPGAALPHLCAACRRIYDI